MAPFFFALLLPLAVKGFVPTSRPLSVAVRTQRFASSPPPIKDKNRATQFNPFDLPPDDMEATAVNVEEHVKKQTAEKNLKFGIWASRALLLLVAAIWGTNFASVKYLETLCFHPPCNHPPSEAAFARFGVAALVSFPLLFRQRWEVIAAGLECGMWITLGYSSQALALSTIDSGKCAFICSLTVVFVPVVSALLYGKPIKSTNVIAGAVALAGVGVLEGMVDFNSLLGIAPAIADTGVASGLGHASSSIETATSAIAESSTGPMTAVANSLGVSEGDLLALGQPIGFGYSFARIEHYQEKFKDVPNRVLTIAAAQCVAVGILSLFWMLSDYNFTIPDFGYMLEPHRLAAIGWTGIVTTVVAIFLEGIALQTASANDAALTFSTEPVWASIFGFILLNETLGTNSYIGGVIIMSACLIGSVGDLLASKNDANDFFALPDEE